MSTTAVAAPAVPLSWDVSDEQLREWGFPVATFTHIVGHTFADKPGTSREEALRLAEAAGLVHVPLFMPTKVRKAREAARRAAAAVSPAEDAKRKAQNDAWLATPGNVLNGDGTPKVR